MSHHSTARAVRQLDTITLEEGMARTNNWRQAIKAQFKESSLNVPSGFFISLIDLQEIVNFYKDYKDPNGVPRPCVGARVYLTLPKPVPPGKPIPPDQIAGVLVPCYEEPIDDNDPLSSVYRDIVVPVEGERSGDYSIYDVTQPCPPMCDPTSPLR